MADLTTLMRHLGRDPIMQAMLQAESAASCRLQLRLLDAVLMDEHRQVAQMLEEEDHSRLLSDDFFLPLSILLVGKASPKVLQAFIDHGYNQSTRPTRMGLSGDVKMSDLALWTCDATRQRELFECGFLSVKAVAYAAMGSADPAVFDLWSDLYLEDEANKKHQSPPQATLAIFRFLPEVDRSTPTPTSQGLRAELSRRLEKMIDGFLATHYPGDPQAAWSAFVSDPPNVAQHAPNALGCVAYMRVLIDRQMSKHPPLRDLPLAADFTRPHMGNRQVHLVHALLQSGTPLAAFPVDLSRWALGKASEALRRGENPPEALSLLWGEIVAKLRTQDPARLDALPRELCSEFASLQHLRTFQTDEERLAFCDMLDMHLTAPPAVGISSRPRM